MSKSVDERIVQMQFQNDTFEKNIQTSISSINQLNSSLNLTGASKGLENVSSAAKSIDMSGVSESVSTLSSRFSALEVMGVTALVNITNSAVNAGKRIASALTIEPVKSGFEEYELKMDSIKTIMASTGESLETVNGYLDELNKYSDETIYSFSDMTNNIGKFTNAGVKLEDAVAAIKGVANEAAVSGANANEASRAMYNFAQALSAGYVKLIDWKSIENANMATVEFKEQLLETAIACGTVQKTADGMYETITTNANGKVSEAFNATQNFNDSLAHQWMTSEVLTETLKKYTDVNTEIGKKATAAATEVTKLSQAFDVMKETAQSGWAKTWELIFGDLDQAKSVFTRLTNFVTGIIDGISDARNAIIEGALGGNPFSNLMGKLDSSGLSTLKKYSDATEKLSGDLEYYQDIVNKVWHGDYKNADTGRYELLDADGYDHRIVQDLVNKGFQYQLTLEDVTASQAKFGETVSETTDSVGEIVDSLEDLTDEQLKNAGLTNEEIKMLRELGEKAKKTGVPLSELLENMSKVDGRTLLIEAFANLGKTIGKVFGAIKGAWAEVFPTSSAATTLYNILEGFHNLTEKLLITDETAENLKRTFAGVFSILGIGVDILKKIVGLAATIFGTMFDGISPLGGGILGVTAKIGDFIVNFRQSISTMESFKEVVGSVVGKIRNAITIIKDFVIKVVDLAKSIKSFDDFKQVGSDMISGLIDGIKEKASAVIEPILNVGRTLLDAIKDFFGINSPSLVFMAIGGFIIAGLVAGLKDTSSISDAFGSISSVFETFVSGIVKVLNFLWSIVGPIVSAIGGLVTDLVNGIRGTVANADMGDILDAVDTGLLGVIILSFKKFIDSLSSITGGAGGMLDNIKGILDGVRDTLSAYQNAINAEALMNIAKAVGILVVALIAISFLDVDKIRNGLAGLGGVMLELGLLVKKSGLSSIGLKAGTGILCLSLALLILAGVIAIFGHMSLETIGIGLLAVYGVLEAVSGALTRFANTKGVVSAGFAITLVANALLILSGALAIMGNLSLGTIVKGLAAMSVSLWAVTSALNNIKYDSNVGAAIAITIVANALLILSGALAIMGNLSLPTLAKGLGAMGVALAELVIALNSMKGTFAGSAALLVAVIALSLLAPVLITLGMAIIPAALGLLILAGAFLVFGVAGLVLGPLTEIILALTEAIALAGVGMAAAGVGMLAAATALTLLAAVGAPAAVALQLIFQTLISLIPSVIKAVGEGIVQLASVIVDGFPVIAEAIAAVIVSLAEALIEAVPPLMEALGIIITSVLDIIIEALPRILEICGELLVGLLELIAEALPPLFKIICTLLDGIIDLIIKYIPKLVDAGLRIIAGILKAIKNHLTDIVATALECIAAFINGIAEGLPSIIDAAFNLVASFINGLAEAIRGNNTDIVDACWNLITAIIDAIGENFGRIKEKAKEIPGKMKAGLMEVWNDMKGIGEYLIDGFIAGITGTWEKIKEKAYETGEKIIGWFKGVFGIESPSKVFKGIAVYCAKGLVVGLENSSNMVANAAKDLANNLIDSFGNPALQVSDVVSDEINAEPTIKPVIDLSNVRKGAKTIGGLFADKTLSLNTQPISALAASISGIQNENSNDDIISAINGLRKDLVDNPKTINNINGVTYDDGSNIVSAVETIVRAAKIGGRV